jgi:lipid-binding SYLF domain-containing protein
MRKFTAVAALGLALGAGIIGCSTEPKGDSAKSELKSEASGSLAHFKGKDPGLESMLNSAYGYAIFPSVGKGGLGVGGSYGHGEVYEQGRFVGYADITQVTVGLQIGGQEFAELILFQDAKAMERFKYGKVKFSANASAVAVKAGASASAKYSDGVLIFTDPKGGLMAEASVGGQEFGFKPAPGQ